MANPSEFVPEGVSDLPWNWTHGDDDECVLWQVGDTEVVARGMNRKDASFAAHSASQYRKACELLEAVDLRCMTPGALHIGGADCSQLTGEREHWCPPCQARAFLSAAREFGKGGR